MHLKLLIFLIGLKYWDISYPPTTTNNYQKNTLPYPSVLKADSKFDRIKEGEGGKGGVILPIQFRPKFKCHQQLYISKEQSQLETPVQGRGGG